MTIKHGREITVNVNAGQTAKNQNLQAPAASSRAMLRSHLRHGRTVGASSLPAKPCGSTDLLNKEGQAKSADNHTLDAIGSVMAMSQWLGATRCLPRSVRNGGPAIYGCQPLLTCRRPSDHPGEVTRSKQHPLQLASEHLRQTLSDKASRVNTMRTHINQRNASTVVWTIALTAIWLGLLALAFRADDMGMIFQ